MTFATAVTKRLGCVALWTALITGAGCSSNIDQVWKYKSFSASQSSPAVAGDLIVFGTRSGEVHAVTKEGAFRWKFQTRKEVISAPAIVDNLILFGSTNSNFYAVDMSGRQVWKYPTLDRIKGDPVAVGKDVVFGSYDKHLYRLQAADRELVWVFPDDLGADEEAEAPAEDEKKEGDAADGAPAKKAVDKSMWPMGAFSYAQPTVTSGGLILAGNLDGHIYAVDVKTGELKWRFATEGVAQNLGVTSTIVERDGVLYFGANDGHVYAVNLGDRKVKWKFKTNDEVNSSPTFDDQGTLFVGSRDKRLYALDAATGAKKWEFVCEGPILSQPVVYQTLVIFGAGEGDGHVYAVNTQTGKEFWKFKTEGAVDADPYLDGDRFYIASADRNLYAFQIKKTP